MYRISLVFIHHTYTGEADLPALYEALCCHITQQPLVYGTIFPYRCFIGRLMPDDITLVRDGVIIVNLIGRARRIHS